MDRELRRLRRESVKNAAEEQKVVTGSFDEIEKSYNDLIKMLKAQIKSYSAAILQNRVQFANLQKQINDYTKY